MSSVFSFLFPSNSKNPSAREQEQNLSAGQNSTPNQPNYYSFDRMPDKFIAVKSPNAALANTNCAIVHPKDFPEKVEHIQIHSAGKDYVFTIRPDSAIASGQIGFGDAQRKWAMIQVPAPNTPLAQIPDLRPKPYRFEPSQYLASVTLEVDFYVRTQQCKDPYDSEKLGMAIQEVMGRNAFTKDQIIAFKYPDVDSKLPPLRLVVKRLEAIDINAVTDNGPKGKRGGGEPPGGVGCAMPNTIFCFEKAEGSNVELGGKAISMVQRTTLFNPDWDFQRMGIGGLDNEFSTIFRRAFASRVLPPELIDQLGCKHVRGILLYGPPGTGKTLIARQIGKMLNAREPQIVSGPSILDKYVGESEANIRKLFAAAEEEEKKRGVHSGLHIIIFDEIDAICKARGSVSGNTGVHDTIVNQLLAKMDGVDQLNNILVIGMTNRRDMIDEALLRPGRMEVQMEISLPDEAGRVQILNIHTARMREMKKLAPDVDLKVLASLTKNFSGAELEGLVRAAQSTAINRLVKAANKVIVDPDAAEKLMVTNDDFLSALATDIKPAFGLAEEVIDRYMKNGIMIFDPSISELLELGNMYVSTIQTSDTQGVISILLEGSTGCGKTALAAKICKNSNFPFIKVCSPNDMIGFTESAKCLAVKKVFDDAYKSELSCVLVDDIEGLMDYTPVGPRFSNLVLHALRSLLRTEPPKNHKLIVLGTTSVAGALEELGLLPAFTSVAKVPEITRAHQLANVLENLDVFNEDEIKNIQKHLDKKILTVGIKKLLALCSAMNTVDRNQRVATFLAKLESERHVMRA